MEEDSGAESLREERLAGSVVGHHQGASAVHALDEVFESVLKHKNPLTIT